MSAALPAVLFACCSLFTLLLLRSYLPLRSTPEYVLAPVFFAILIPCSIVLLVPIDLASAADAKGIVLGETARLVGWRIGYWLCFVLTWAILPILQSFSDSGHRSTRGRLIQSLRENARYQAIILVTGLVFLVYFISTSGLSFRSLYALVIALAHSYALSLAIYLMGHGLVALPRRFFQDASVTGKLRRLQTKAVGTYDNLMDATAKLLEVQEEVRLLQQRKHTVAADFQDWIDELGDITSLPESHLSPRERTMLSQSVHFTAPSSVPPQIVTEEYLASLARRLKTVINKRTRYISEWGNLLQGASNCQHILDSVPARALAPFPRVAARGSKPASLFPENWTLLTPYTRYLLHVYLIPFLRRFVATILALASISIVWSEIVSSFAPKLSLLSLTISWGGGGVVQQTITASWIAYMVISSLLSLSSVRLWNGYALIPRKTSGGSACFYASYAARLTVPLSYNFLTMLAPQQTHWRETVFHSFLGKQVNLTPLGEWFNMFFPMLVLLPVSASLFNWYERVKEWCGFGDYFNWGDEEEGEGGPEAAREGGRNSWVWREGRELIERELGAPVSASTGFLSTSGSARGSVRGNGGASGRGSVRSNAGSLGPAAARRVRLETGIAGVGEEDEGLGFGGFFHRVKNTVETVLPGRSEEGGFGGDSRAGRPRWMGQEAGAAGSRGVGSGVGSGAGSGDRPSWFRMFTGVGGDSGGRRG
ncbi:LMBR1-like membrane protein-domain-containing protein [Kalaharituber pfeilii]|nr:LMBR1-like membrane protein-domain-containing protein [Kalaharituber pfeilii]